MNGPLDIYGLQENAGLHVILSNLIWWMSVVLMIYYYFSQVSSSEIKEIMSTIEALAWMLGSSVTIYTTFKLGTRVSGGFINIFMFFQFSAYAAFTWKFLGLLESISWSVPYSIHEVVETLFGIFAIISVYLLARMWKSVV